MKSIFLSAFLLIGLQLFSQEKHNGLPVIKASKTIADYRFNDSWSRGNWSIAPEASPDVLEIPCFNKTVSFAFYTDKDSIAFPINASAAKQFYVLTADGKYALTEVRGYNYTAAAYDATPKKPAYQFWYENGNANAFLQQLKTQYPVQQLVQGLSSDSAKALRILKWVHDQWKHDGSNEPKKKDALSILQEVKEGKRFRCVEYGIVTTAALNAIGLPARVLALKTKDVETTASGAGHVLLEVYLKDLNKWALLDGQWDAMPVLNGKETLGVIKKDASLNDVPIVFFTTSSSELDKMYCRRFGVEMITKPPQYNHLKEAVKRLLDNYLKKAE
ncbi:MAG: hypothetical protein EOO10_12945 [Chitinophagaceae bacterium]|nr:MAG: hypothetical protein EOO10_12945 [Chitinophagaceae bacterium]